MNMNCNFKENKYGLRTIIFAKAQNVYNKDTDKIMLLEELAIPAPPDIFEILVCRTEAQKELEINIQLVYQPTLGF